MNFKWSAEEFSSGVFSFKSWELVRNNWPFPKIPDLKGKKVMFKFWVEKMCIQV